MTLLASSISSDILAVVGGIIAAISLGVAAGGIASTARRGALRQLRVGLGGIELELAGSDEAELRDLETRLQDLRLRLAAVDAGAKLPELGNDGRTEASSADVSPPDAVLFDQPRVPEVQASENDADGGLAPEGMSEEPKVELGRSEELLTAYHALGLAQSRVMFWFSVIFASLGFALIALTVVVTVSSAHPSIESGNLVSLISGAIVEAVSALFFVQSNRARALMTAFFDRLRSDRSLDRALKLADEVPDELIRSRLKAMLAFSLANASPSDGNVEMVLSASVQALPASGVAGSPSDAIRTEH